VKRWWAALALQEVLEEKSAAQIAERLLGAEAYQHRTRQAWSAADLGMLQAQAAVQAGQLAALCSRLKSCPHHGHAGLWKVEALLEGLQARVSLGVRGDLLPLMEIPFVKKQRARALFAAGFTTPERIATADVAALVTVLERTSDAADVLRQPQDVEEQQRLEAAHRARLFKAAKEMQQGARRLLVRTLRGAKLAVEAQMEHLTSQLTSSQPVAQPTPDDGGRTLVVDLHLSFEDFLARWSACEEYAFYLYTRGAAHGRQLGPCGLQGLVVCLERGGEREERDGDDLEDVPDEPGTGEHSRRLDLQVLYVPLDGAADVSPRLQAILLGLAREDQRKVTCDLQKQLLRLYETPSVDELLRGAAAMCRDESDGLVRIGGDCIDVFVAEWMLRPGIPWEYRDDKGQTKHESKGEYLLAAATQGRCSRRQMARAEEEGRRARRCLQQQQQGDGGVAATAEGVAFWCRSCYQLMCLWKEQAPVLEREQLMTPLLQLEMPMARVLARMERVGVGYDPAHYEAMVGPLREALAQLEQQAHAESGHRDWAHQRLSRERRAVPRAQAARARVRQAAGASTRPRWLKEVRLQHRRPRPPRPPPRSPPRGAPACPHQGASHSQEDAGQRARAQRLLHAQRHS